MAMMYKIMMNRPALGTVTLMDMIPTEEAAGILASETKDLMDRHGFEVYCFVASYEEARNWDNDGRPTQRT